MDNEKIPNPKERQYRVVTFLNREDLDFLDSLAKDLYFSYGINMPRTKLIEEIIDAFKQKGNKESIEEELLKRFKKESDVQKGGK
ncbi:MAG: hypothetical protein WCI77_09835 [Candidatus Omnitrophota bacterium]